MPSQEAVACIKLILAKPALVDEFADRCVKASDRTVVFQLPGGTSITHDDIRSALSIILESAFWTSHIIPKGIGAKARRFLFTAAPAAEPSSESDVEVGMSDDDDKMSVNSNAGIRTPEPSPSRKKAPLKSRTFKPKESVPPVTKRRRLLKSKARTPSSPSSSSSSSSAKSSGSSHSSSRGSSSSSRSSSSSDSSSVASSKSSPPTQVPIRQPATYSNVGGMKENLRPDPVKPTPAPSPSPVQTQPMDWASDFGQIVKQALQNSSGCPFKTLGLPSSCTSVAEVKKRWSKLILLLHPDKAPVEWRGNPELAEAAQAVNQARTAAEARISSAALIKPPPPVDAVFSMAVSGFGGRVAELRWQPPKNCSVGQTIDKYLLFIKRHPQLQSVGSVKAGADPWFVLSEDDVRHKHFFTASSLEVHIHSANAAGTSSALIVSVPLSNAPRVVDRSSDEAERMFQGLKHLTAEQLQSTLERFKPDQLRTLLRTEAAIRMSLPEPPPSGQGSKSLLISRLVELLTRRN